MMSKMRSRDARIPSKPSICFFKSMSSRRSFSISSPVSCRRAIARIAFAWSSDNR